MVEGWRNGLDVLLVFVSRTANRYLFLLISKQAGLFSVLVTMFVAQTSWSRHGQVTAALLFELIDVQPTAANGSLVNAGLLPFSDLRPTTYDSLVNGLWFSSLSSSLTIELFAVLTKQWIHQYTAVLSGAPRDSCRVRQFRFVGLQQRRVGFTVGQLPVLMRTLHYIFLVD